MAAVAARGLKTRGGEKIFHRCVCFVCARAPLEELKAAAGKSLVSQLQEHRTREYDSRRARIKKGLIILLFR